MAHSEGSASNNLENRVISTSSCNTMTPIHQSHLLHDAVGSDPLSSGGTPRWVELEW